MHVGGLFSSDRRSDWTAGRVQNAPHLLVDRQFSPFSTLLDSRGGRGEGGKIADMINVKHGSG